MTLQTTLPPDLYKYVAPDRAIQLLKRMRIRFSQVSVLNDADEFQPPHIALAPRAELENQIRERFKLKHPDMYAQIYNVLPPAEAKRLLSEEVLRWADTAEANYEQSVRTVYEIMDQNFGLLSLSATLTSKLMWSFYSDGGRGVAVEFDSHHPWFNSKTSEDDSFRHLRKVRYVEDRKPNYFLAIGEDIATKDDEVLYTKTSEWHFEEEWRIIRNFKDAVESLGPDAYGKDILLFDIPSSALKSIVLGYRLSAQVESALRDITNGNPALSHVTFRRAVREANGHIEILQAFDI